MMQNLTQDITVIIPTYKTSNNNIDRFIQYRDFKVIILDQSNDLYLKNKIKNYLHSKLTYYAKDKNLGFGVACNFLVSKVKTKYCLLTQADVFINKKTIISLKDSLISNSNYIISAPMLTNSNKIYKNQKKNIKNVKQISVVKNVIAACFLLDVKKIKKIGFFDENFFLYWEDIDLCRRIKNTQYKIILNKELLALHEGSKSSDNNLSMMYLRLSNYKYGEYLYDYKYHKLRIIKTIRQIFQKIIYFLGNVFIFKFKKAFFEIATLVGILKFFIFFLKDNIKFFFFKK